MPNNGWVSNAPQPSIRFLVARESPIAVLLRRGPSDLVQCLSWNLETDEVTPGQWLKGRIYAERCDLSPDGRLFVYFAANFEAKEDWRKDSWTAISRPPFLTALALWFKGGTYFGGGLFKDNRTLLINDLAGHEYAEGLPKPRVKMDTFQESTDRIEEVRMVRDGWHAERSNARPRILSKSAGIIEVTETFSYQKFREIRSYTASVGDHPLDLQGAKQADIDAPRSRIIYTVGGKVLATDGTATTQIADLTENKFQPLAPAKWTTEWP